MPFMPRRVVAATITVAALGAGAAPALATTASTTTPLAAAIAKANPLVRQRISLRTEATRGRAVTELRNDAKRCERYAAVVADVQADGSAQRLAQREWVAGVRLQAAGNKQLVAGLLANAKGVTAAGKREVQRGLTTLNRADGLTGHANELLAGDASGPAPTLP